MANAYYAARERVLMRLLKDHGVQDEEIAAALSPSEDRRIAWFMYDCHAFSKIHETGKVPDPVHLTKRLRELFKEDGCGIVFVRQWPDGPEIPEFKLQSDWNNNGHKWEVSDAEIAAWVDRFVAWTPPSQP